MAKIGNKLAALTIAGSDSGGGAGIQADLLSFAARGVYGTSVITCLTAQNPDGVSHLQPAGAQSVRAQLEQVTAFYPLGAIKTGMLLDAATVQSVADWLEGQGKVPLVVDPVMVASSGAVLLEADARRVLCEKLLPRARLITPNLDEAALLLDRRIGDESSMLAAAQDLRECYGCAVLVKGGHLEGATIMDILVETDGSVTRYESRRIQNVDTHGSGCTLSSAIAAEFLKGADMRQAVASARDYLRQGMRQALEIGGRAFINHFPRDEG